MSGEDGQQAVGLSGDEYERRRARGSIPLEVVDPSPFAGNAVSPPLGLSKDNHVGKELPWRLAVR
jgi:hypothetical protein